MKLHNSSVQSILSGTCLVSAVFLSSLTSASTLTQVAVDLSDNNGNVALCRLDKNDDYQLLFVDATRVVNTAMLPQSTVNPAVVQPVLPALTNRNKYASNNASTQPASALETMIGDRWAINGTCPTRYNIGDIGPNGGIVYHVSESGYKGLEVAYADAIPKPWGCLKQFLDTSEFAYDGRSNTNTIVDTHDAENAECASYTAAKYTQDFANNTGWHLPSHEELIFLYSAWFTSGVSEIQSLPAAYYWTSTSDVYNADKALFRDFSLGGFFYDFQDQEHLAVPVHAFAYYHLMRAEKFDYVLSKQ